MNLYNIFEATTLNSDIGGTCSLVWRCWLACTTRGDPGHRSSTPFETVARCKEQVLVLRT